MLSRGGGALISGNTGGLKASQTRALERLAGRSTRADVVVTPEMARAMTELSREIQRQIGVLLDRRGRVFSVVVGDARGVFLPELPRAGGDRLRGLRLVHTHLHQEGINDDDLTDLALLRLDLVAAIIAQPDGLPGPVHIAHLLPANPNNDPWIVQPPAAVHALPADFREMMDALEEEFARTRAPRRAGDQRDRAVLAHVSGLRPADAADRLAELRELARSAGLVVAHEVVVRRDPEPKFVMGKGNLKATLIKAMQLGAEVLVFDCDLTPAQVKALADLTDLKILDRTQVILDIFGQHAVTREGRLQVELAQLRYLLPRLGMKHTAFSRLAGGIGGRGPGETKLEVDRRRVRDRISHLEREVRQLGQRRELRRGARRRKGVPTVAVVGYTNAGKSTLLNSLTQSSVIAEDALFATLNPVSRRLRFPEEREVIVTDTVGFIRDLPPDLMAAFRTTFEELRDADLLLHVIDASAHDLEAKHGTVRRVLRELELDGTPTVCVLNKADRCDAETLQGLADQYAGIPICALDRSTFRVLLETLERHLWAGTASQ